MAHDHTYRTTTIYILFVFSFSVLQAFRPDMKTLPEIRTAGCLNPAALSTESPFKSTNSLFYAICLFRMHWHRTARMRCFQWVPHWSPAWKAQCSIIWVCTIYREIFACAETLNNFFAVPLPYLMSFQCHRRWRPYSQSCNIQNSSYHSSKRRLNKYSTSQHCKCQREKEMEIVQIERLEIAAI